jgi:hypothetical protein
MSWWYQTKRPLLKLHWVVDQSPEQDDSPEGRLT